MREVLDLLCQRTDLDGAATETVFRELVAGKLDPLFVAAFLAALRSKGETPSEVAGAAKALLDSALPFPRPDYPFADLVGTGGDGAGTINLSTAAALTVAAAGLPVAKHGNRSVSSQCGSADVLEALGVRIDPQPDVARRGLDECGFCFLFAPQYHSGLKHAMPVRKALGIRTTMNLLGPLVNPARPTILLVGVYDPRILHLVGAALSDLDADMALVVHGSGIDEVALHGSTDAVRLHDGQLESLHIVPEEVGLQRHALEGLRGGDADANAARLRSILAGQGSSAEAAAVALNAGALLWISGHSESLTEGVKRAGGVLATGKPLEVVEAYGAISHG